MPELAAIRAALSEYSPRLETPAEARAAVALVLRAGAGGAPEALFIERARHRGDPWSGHMAFPGGRLDATDSGARAAAERETREEVGLDLGGAEALGRLDDLQGRHAGRRTGLVVSAFVYHHRKPAALSLNHEVAAALWVPLAALRDPQRHVDHTLPVAEDRPFPGIRVGEAEPHVVWGLTYRFVEEFLRIVGQPLPDRWQAF